MTTLTLGQSTFHPTVFQQLGRLGCAWFERGLGWRIFFAAPFQGRVRAFQIDQTVAMPARGILTIRPTTTHLTPFAFHGDWSDFSGGGAMGVNPWGDDDPIEVHDRIMQRCPVGRYDIATGQPILTPVPGYNLSGFAPCPGYANAKPPAIEYDGEHRSRAYRVAVRHLADPFVLADMRALHEDAALFWRPYAQSVLMGPMQHGHGYVGRSAAWFAFSAAEIEHHRDCELMRDVYCYTINPATGSPQRLKQGQFYGSPDPWGDPDHGGSGVPAGVDVFQDIEQYHTIAALYVLGMYVEAEKLADTVLAYPKKKWIRCDNGEGVGEDYAEIEQAWIGLGALARINPAKARAYMKRWPIRHPYNGSQVGPFQDPASIKAALVAWNCIGKTRLALEVL